MPFLSFALTALDLWRWLAWHRYLHHCHVHGNTSGPLPLPSPPPPKKPSKHIFIDGVVSKMIPGRKRSPDRKWSPKFDRKWTVENLIKDQSNFALVIISRLILIIFSLDNVRTLLREILCWSLLGHKVQIRSLLIGKLT